ncbi:hypothetical protein JXO59_13260 [candidate division KSB1 bacterium]|nr:hypothetical protein [candidate division KSB1 bacterium]
MRTIISAIIAILLVVSCDDDKPITGPRGPVEFEVSPVTYDAIFLSTPLGNLNPPGHTFPSNHMGFYLHDQGPYLVRAHAAGTIDDMYYNAGYDDYRIQFKHSETFYSYLDHIENPYGHVRVGVKVAAGDSIGWASDYLDFGVVDWDTTRYFVVPGRYHEYTLHCGDAYLYFAKDVREALLARNTRTVEPRGGKIDYDIDGALVGNWFLEGTPVSWEASSYLYAEAQIAFVYDMWDPRKIVIACGGGWSAAPFCCPVYYNAPDPATVTQASGFVKYQTTHAASHDVVAVQLVQPRRLKVEVFADQTSTDVAGFTANAKIYVR